MTSADVWKIVLIHVGTLIVVISYWVLSEALFPKMVERARIQYNLHSVPTTFLGLVIAAPAFIIGGVLMNKSTLAPVKLGGAILFFLPIFLGLLGSAGLVKQIGRGLPSPGDEGHPWKKVLRGGTVLSLTFVLPLIGWFAIMPWTIISGLGAYLASFRSPDRKLDREDLIRPEPEPQSHDIEAMTA